MKAIFIRHAKPLSEGYAEDFLRPLSKEGRRLQKEAACKLQDRGIRPDAIYTSPLLRAIETAEILGEFFSLKPEIEEALGSDFSPEILLERLKNCPEGSTLFFVGHFPTLISFINALAGKEAVSHLSQSSSAVIEFKGVPAYGKGHFLGIVA